MGGGRIAGEIASTEVLTVGEKAVCAALLVAGFNLFIGLFNFVPLLPLDGGHIAGALYEAVRRGGRPAAAPTRPRLRRRRQAAAGGVRRRRGLLVMGLVLIVADIVVPVQFS